MSMICQNMIFKYTALRLPSALKRKSCELQ